jgi:GT2 family glycosyltransferase
VQPTRILIVDNGSCDHSIEQIFLPPNATVKALRNNLGFAGGNNYGLKACRTDLVALLNPDAFPEPDWMKQLLAAAQQYPDVAAFGSCQRCWSNPEILDGTGDRYHMSGLVRREGYGRRPAKNALRPREIFSPCAAAALYRRKALADIGGFDNDFFCYVEDVDLGFRLRLAGHTARFVPKAVVHHVGSASTGGRHSDFALYHGHRNLVWAFVKNMPGFLFWAMLPVHVAMNLATLLVFMLRGRYRVILRAKRDALRQIPREWRKRRAIQSLRKASIRAIWRMIDKHPIPKNRI